MEAITNLYLPLLSAVLISLSGVMMPGPVFSVAVTEGYTDKTAGALIAFGHGVIEFPLMSLFFGFAQFFAPSVAEMVIGTIGGIMLMYMCIEMFKAREKTPKEGDAI